MLPLIEVSPFKGCCIHSGDEQRCSSGAVAKLTVNGVAEIIVVE